MDENKEPMEGSEDAGNSEIQAQGSDQGSEASSTTDTATDSQTSNLEKESDKEKDLGEELADVLFVVLCLANQTGVNLQQSFEKKLEIKTKRDHDRHHSNQKLK